MLLKMGSEMGEKREEARKRFWKREEEIRKEDAAGGEKLPETRRKLKQQTLQQGQPKDFQRTSRQKSRG